jgi:CheY-like chemotaxis protein
MNILIVEDDPFKYAQVKAVVLSVVPTAEVVYFGSVHGAVQYLKHSGLPDKIILDMSLPTHTAIQGEGNPVSLGSGGVEVLLTLRRLRKFSIPVAILTQYNDFEIEDEFYTLADAPAALSICYGMDNVIAVLYEHDSVTWIDLIRNFLEQ